MTVMRLRLGTLCLALFSVSATAVDLRDYFPTPNGITWSYAFSDWAPGGKCAGERSVTVDTTATGRVKLLTATVRADNCPSAPSTETFVTGAPGFRLLSRLGSTQSTRESSEWNPAVLVLPTRLNIYQASQSSGYLTEAAAVRVAYRATVKLVGVEKLAVPAGTFQAALHLQLIETRDYPPPMPSQVVVRTDRWLGRGIGTLKLRTEVVVDGKVARSSQLQLICSTLTDVQSRRCLQREKSGE
jgi:hypothetical protein